MHKKIVIGVVGITAMAATMTSLAGNRPVPGVHPAVNRIVKTTARPTMMQEMVNIGYVTVDADEKAGSVTLTSSASNQLIFEEHNGDYTVSVKNNTGDSMELSLTYGTVVFIDSEGHSGKYVLDGADGEIATDYINHSDKIAKLEDEGYLTISESKEKVTLQNPETGTSITFSIYEESGDNTITFKDSDGNKETLNLTDKTVEYTSGDTGNSIKFNISDQTVTINDASTKEDDVTVYSYDAGKAAFEHDTDTLTFENGDSVKFDADKETVKFENGETGDSVKFNADNETVKFEEGETGDSVKF
jgi:hypothetical protein